MIFAWLAMTTKIKYMFFQRNKIKVSTTQNKFTTREAKYSVAALFLLFILISTVFFFLTITFFVAPKITEMVERTESVSHDNEIATVQNNIEHFITSRAQILQDMARSPVLVNGVMQSSDGNAYLKDFMDDLLLFGNKEKFYLANILGKVIHKANSNDEKHIQPEELWFHDILGNKKEFTFEIIKKDREFFFQIAVPVKFNGLPEGVFFTDIKIDPIAMTGIDFANMSRAFSLKSRNKKTFQTDFKHIVKPLQITRELSEIGAVLVYTFDHEILKREERKLLNDILLRFIGAGFLSFLLFALIGNKIIVAPYQHLKSSEEKLRHLNENLEMHTNKAQTATARMEAILGTAADAIITVDLKGKIQSFNHAAEKIFGYKIEEVLNKNIKMLMPASSQEKYDEYLEKYLSTGKKKIIDSVREELALRKNGEIFPIGLSVSEVKTDEIHLFFTWLIQDISKRKNSERKLVQYAHELEGKKLELEQAKEIAVQANKAKSEFLANMSHEIRTPMNGIIGTTSLITETDLSEKQENYIKIIRNSSEALLQLINDILDFSKIEAGKLDFEILPFDLKTLVEEVKSMMHIHVKEGVDLQIDWVEDTPRYVQSDPGRIRQILFNLTSNAIKFTEEGSIKLSVKSDGEEAGKHRFIVSVEDTGIGIPADKLDYIFDKFGQAEESTTRRFGGTGLGLAICSELVRMMEGDIYVESVEGQGSKFWFTMLLPLSTEQEAEDNSRPKDSTQDFDKVQFEHVHVLIAEDNRTNMMIATEMLEGYGCHVTPAGNGIEAMERIQNQEFDLILMDCMMPEMDGYEATTNIRQWEKKKQRSATPIIALTANAMKGDRDKCLAAGMDDYLPKPVKKTELAAVLVKWLSGKK